MRLSQFFLLLAVGLLALPSQAADVALYAPEYVLIHVDTPAAVAGLSGVRWVRPGVARVPVSATAGNVFAENATGRRQALDRALGFWGRQPGVRRVEPDHLGRFAESTATTDPLRAQQGWFDRIEADAMWSLARGDQILIAVVDSGVQRNHPDLVGSLADGGWDFGDDDADPEDCLGHGTAVTGIIAARADNGIGIAGVAPGVRILPIKVSSCRGDPTTYSSSAVAQAIDLAVARGARIVNLSLNVSEATTVLTDAINAALNRGVVVVAAAGNRAGPVAFPANLPGVIAVGGTDAGGLPVPYWASGPEIAVFAPAEAILTTSLAGDYASRTGTSFAAPMVSAGLAALLSANPKMPGTTAWSLLQSATASLPGQTGGELRLGEAAKRFAAASFNVRAQTVRNGNLLDVTAELEPNAAHLGMSAQIFIAAFYNQQSWMKVGEGWLPLTMPLQAARSATLQSGLRVPVVSALDITALEGTEIYIGYGASADDMLANRRYTSLLVIR